MDKAENPQEIYALCRADKSKIFHIRYTLEAYEGLCLPSTLPGGGGRVLVVADGRARENLIEVLAGLAEEVGLEVLEWGTMEEWNAKES